MEFTFERTTITGGTVEADLSELIGRVNSHELMEAIGLQLAALWKRSFDEPDLRPAPWPPRKGVQPAKKGSKKRMKGDHPLMKETGHFWRSPKPTTWTNNSVTVSSDVPYAAIHQFGGSVPTRYKGFSFAAPVKKHYYINKQGRSVPTRYKGFDFTKQETPKLSYAQVPARPTFPITPDGRLTPYAETTVFDVVDGFLNGN